MAVLHGTTAIPQRLLSKLVGKVATLAQRGCEQADQGITVDVTTHVDPSCISAAGEGALG